MIPYNLNEYNPIIHHYRERIKDNQLLYVRDFFSRTIGPFELLKMWHNVAYNRKYKNPNGSHWFHYYTMKIRTASGDTYYMREEYLTREGVFNTRIKI